MSLYTIVIGKDGKPRKTRGTDPVTLKPAKRVARLSRTEQQATLLRDSFERQQAAMLQNRYPSALQGQATPHPGLGIGGLGSLLFGGFNR